MASLEIKLITKRFGNVLALSHIDLYVEDGEFCVLLGPSGCGKSTLLNIVAGLISQDEGSVSIDGKPADRLSPRERDVAMVFQSYALYPHMTVAQNIGFGLRMRKLQKALIEERVLEAANLLGIEDLLNRKPRELSGGQRQRVAMGRALVRRPKIFLLDEPLSNLDARLRAKVRLELKQLHHHIKGTIIYVTHDQVEAMTLGERVVVMRNGKVCQAASPEDIYEQPADIFVASFIGSPEMNMYNGRVIYRDKAPYFQGEDFSVNLENRHYKLKDNVIDIGIRPEDIKLSHSRDEELQSRIEMISNIGSEKFIHARTGKSSFTVRVPKEADFRAGQIITLNVDPDKVHVFCDGRRV